MSLKVKISSLIIVLCAMLWFTPQGVNLMLSQYTTIINASRCVLWGILLCYTFVKHKRLSKFCIAVHSFWLVFLFCIVMSDFSTTNLNTWLIPFCSTCGICLIFELYEPKSIVFALFRYFYVISIVNLVLLFIMPQGFVYQVSAYDGLSAYNMHSNFISSDNMYAPFLLCFLLLGEIYHEYYCGKKRFVYGGMWVIGLVTAIKIFSATCLVALTIYSAIIFLRKHHLGIGKIKLWKVVLSFFAIFILIYYFKIQNLFSFIIVGILGKDITLTGRIGLWERAIEMIGQKWLFGWGNWNRGAIILRDYYYWYAHNLILDILLEGGLITFGAFSLLIYRMGKEIRRYISCKAISYCLYVMFAFVILNITESYFSSVYFYIPMIVAVSFAGWEKAKEYNAI